MTTQVKNPARRSYAEKLKDPRWQKKRLEILERDGWACRYCSDKETTLHVHHKKYNGEPWEALADDLETACEDCHKIIERMKDAETWMLEFLTAILKDKPTLSCGPILMGYILVLTDDYFPFKLEERSGIYFPCDSISNSDVELIIKHRENGKKVL